MLSTEHNHVRARCLYCEAAVEGNQESMKGCWNSFDDFEPVWQHSYRDDAVRNWLWYKSGKFDKYQDFYLCPRHNTAEHFVFALAWAGKQLAVGKYIDFTKVLAPIIPMQLPRRF